MKIIVVAGFLGSGKTTILLEIADLLVAEGKKVAVIENEVGDIGIDGQYVSRHGMMVRELSGGCICCTLTVGLVQALEELSSTFSADYVLVEPTGIAQPAELAASLREYSAHSSGVAVVTILDAARWKMLSAVVGPLLEGQIAHADVVVINKCDAVESSEVTAMLECVAPAGGQAPVVTASADDRSCLTTVLEVVR